ncbi:MAG: NADH-quinone oxidoreductase subunit M [Actinobacteria bacterium]|nr:NADH-quinone oxidoreductase subunit M [Actinomycetota bacterium]
MYLSALLLLPLIGSAVIAALPAGRTLLAKQIALGTSVLTALLGIAMALQFDRALGTFQFVESHEWITSFGVKYGLGIDGTGLVLILMALILAPIVILASWNEGQGGRFSQKAFFALILVLETFMVGVFAATDVFLFYVFFEAMLIPVYFLIGSFGGPNRSYAAVKFLLYSLLGGLLMLAAVIGLYVLTKSQFGAPTYDVTELSALNIDQNLQRWLFLGFFIAFAIKAPMWPLHTWLPDAASAATPGTAILLIGVLDKVGTFGMIRYCLPLFPDAAHYFAPTIVVLAVISIIYGAILAIGQKDLKRLIAFTSISHFGFIVLGIFAMTSTAGAGATLYMFNHGFSTAALFMVAGWMISRRNSSTITDFGGLQRVTPVMAWMFFIAGMSSLALPGLSSFISEVLVLVGAYQTYPVAAIISTVAIVLAALYILIVVQRSLHGPIAPGNESLPDLTNREKVAIAPVIAIIIFLGFVPSVLLNVINPTVTHTLTQVHATEPTPTAGE